MFHLTYAKNLTGSLRGMDTYSGGGNSVKWFCLPSDKRIYSKREREKNKTSFLLKRDLLLKERICSQREQILSFKSRSIFRRGSRGSKFFPLRVDPFSEGDWYPGKQTESLRFQKWRKIYQNRIEQNTAK